MRQTMTTAIMTDYDATATYDRVLHSMSIITCRCLCLPMNACMFMYRLLQSMEYHLVTGFKVSGISFSNDADPSQIDQGILQGSSSAAPIYNVNMDVSLTANKKLAKGANFIHPISGKAIHEFVMQYVDVLLYTTLSMSYKSTKKASGSIQLINPTNNIEITIARIEPTAARCPLGAMFAPNGNSTAQIKHTTCQTREYIGKIKHRKLHSRAKWTALMTVLQPKILYPLVSCQCKKSDLVQIERILTRAKCHALGLNSTKRRTQYESSEG